MGTILFYTGLALLGLELLFRLWFPFAGFVRHLELAGRVGLARAKAGLIPWRAILGVLFIWGSRYCAWGWFWLLVGIVLLLGALLWTAAAIPAGRSYQLQMTETQLREAHRQRKIAGVLQTAALLVLWGYCWRGIGW